MKEARGMRLRQLLMYFSMLLAVAASAVALAPPAHAVTVVRDTPDYTWNTNGTVWATELSADGDTLYIGGKFTTVRENPPGVAGRSLAVSNVAAIDVATGEAISGWNPKVTGGAATVRALEVVGTGASERVFIGGNFTTVGGQPRQHLAAVDAADGSVDPSFAPQVSKTTKEPYVYALLAGESRLYVGGLFSHVNGKGRADLAAFDLATGTLDPTWKPKANDKVQDLEFGPDDGSDADQDGDSIFIAGRFSNITGSNGITERRESLARVQTDTGNLHPWKVPDGVIGAPQQGWDLTVTPTMVYGGFGDGPNFAAAFRISPDPLLNGRQAWRFGTVGNVQTVALSPDGSRLFLGGHFGTNRLEQSVCGGSNNLSGLVSVNPATGQPYCDWIPYLEPSIDNGNGGWTMTGTGEALWVGGGFTHVSGVAQPNIARFAYDPNFKAVNATPWVDLDGLRSGGLDATYFDNANFTGTQLSRTDATVDFNWGSGSPDPSIGSDTFSARWSGQVEAPASGTYTFTTTSDDGVRLFVDGRPVPVIDNWTDHAPTDNTGTIALEAGKRYDIQLHYYENGGGAVARLQWSYPGQARQVVPSARLFFAGNIDYAATFTGTGPTPIVDPSSLTVTDADDVSLRSAKVTLTDRPDETAERLSADAAGTAIAVSYDAQTGVLSLQGPATKAAFQQVLRTVSYDNTSPSPTNGERRVTFMVNDGSLDSKVATSTVTGTAGSDCTTSGTSGNDVLEGTSGDDVICAGAGNDTIKGLEGNDILKGEGGLDTADFSGSLSAITASLADGSASGEGSDTLVSVENLTGSTSADELSGSDVDNKLIGGSGSDSLIGLAGADKLTGSGGNDTLDSRDGVDGNDTLDGGGATDTCTTDATEASILNCEQ
jgi:Ca2+-binding RTX toxin-like protein